MIGVCTLTTTDLPTRMWSAWPSEGAGTCCGGAGAVAGAELRYCLGGRCGRRSPAVARNLLRGSIHAGRKQRENNHRGP